MTRNASPPASGVRVEVLLPQLEQVRLYRQIAALLSERIEKGVFPIGTLLPAERDLAQQFGVSRSTVREALIALEVAGKVSIRVGRGVQILEAMPRAPEIDYMADVDADLSPIQLMEARLHVEPWTAKLASSARTDANLLRMRRAMKAQADAGSAALAQYRDADMQFHIEIARASGNAAFAVVVAALWAYRSKPLFGKFEELLIGPDRPASTVEEHRMI
jgi:DNA-binding FadR family transcriptional regulator